MVHTSPEPSRDPIRPSLDSLAPTGVPQLDLVLGGGLPRGALVILVGPPGSGKTTLASQIAFAGAQRGEQALILTAFSEPTLKLVEHLRGYRFFVPDLMGDGVQILSLQQYFEQSLEAAEQEMIAEARKFQARWVVLDGFQAFRTMTPDQGVLRHVLYRLGSRLSMEGATTLITTEAEPRDVLLFPEMTTGDVLVGLYFELNGMRAERGLEVIKVRGHAPVTGRHSFSLSAEGVTVFPRLETRMRPTPAEGAPAASSARPAGPAGRAGFGLPDLDALLSGGLTRQTSTLLAGSLGTGKTVLALHFALAGVEQGESAVWLSFRETEAQLLEQAESFGLGERLRAALASEGGLRVLHWDPVELDPDRVAHELLSTLEHRGARRLVIDSMSELERAVSESAHPRRVPNYLAALLAALRARGVTLLAIKEIAQAIGAELDFTMDELAVLAENVLLVQQTLAEDDLQRWFWVLTMRYSAHTFQRHALVLAPPDRVRLLPAGEHPEQRGRRASGQEPQRRSTQTSPPGDASREGEET